MAKELTAVKCGEGTTEVCIGYVAVPKTYAKPAWSDQVS